VTKLEYIKKAAYVVAAVYMREINPEKKILAKKRLKLLLGISMMMQVDFYDQVRRPMRDFCRSTRLDTMD
jgi:hypothetical protein